MAKPKIWDNQVSVTGDYFGNGKRNNNQKKRDNKPKNIPNVNAVTDNKGYLKKDNNQKRYTPNVNSVTDKKGYLKKNSSSKNKQNETNKPSYSDDSVVGKYKSSLTANRFSEYDDYTSINNSMDSSLRTRQKVDDIRESKAKSDAEKEKKKSLYEMGESGAQGQTYFDPRTLKTENEKKGESGAQGQAFLSYVKTYDEDGKEKWVENKPTRTQQDIQKDISERQAELDRKTELFWENNQDPNFRTSIRGRRAEKELEDIRNRITQLKEEKPFYNPTDGSNANIERDPVSEYYQGQMNKSVSEIEDMERTYADWGDRANSSLSAAIQANIGKYSNETEAYVKGRALNPYRKQDSGMTNEELKMYDLLYAFGLDDLAEEGISQRFALKDGIGEYNSLYDKLHERGFEVDYIVSDKYKVQAQQLKDEAWKMPFGEAREEKEKQANIYNQMSIAYKQRGDQVNNRIKFDEMFEQDTTLGEQIAAIGAQQDSYANLSKEDRQWAFGASMLGSLNRDDSYKTAASVMTDEELKHYNYVVGLEAEGKVEKGTADKYFKALYESGLNERFAKQYSNALANQDDIDDLTLGSFEIAQGFLNGIVRVGDAFQGIGTSITESVTGQEADIISEKLLDSVLASEKARTGNIGIDVAETIGFMMPAVVTSVVTGGAGAPAVVGMLAAGGTTFATTYGETYLQTRREGYDPETASGYAAINAALEAGLQSVLTGVSSVAGGILTDDFAKFLGSKAETFLANFAQSEGRNALSRAMIKLAGNPLFQKVFKHLSMAAASGIGEFTEESLQEVLDPLVRNMILGENNEINSENVMTAGGMGFLVSMLMNAPTTASLISKTTDRGINLRESRDSLIKKGLESGVGTQPYNTAKWMQANPKIQPDLMLGILDADIREHNQNVKDIQLYRDSVIDWNDLSDAERVEMVDPRNAKINAKLYDIDINEKMSPEEIRLKFEEAHNEKIVEEQNLRAKLTEENNLRSAIDEVAPTDKGLARLLKRLQKLGGREVLTADNLGKEGAVSRSAVILDSSLLETKEGRREAVRRVLAHEMGHMIQNTVAFDSLVDSAIDYVEELNGNIDEIINDYINEAKQNGRTMSENEAYHEIVGDYLRDVLFTDYESLKKFVYDNTSTARKILNVLRNFVNGENGESDSYIREAVNNLEMAFAEAQSQYYNPDVTTEANKNARALESEYNKLVNEWKTAEDTNTRENIKGRLKEIVRQYAESKGYIPTSFFHGTGEFGFDIFAEVGKSAGLGWFTDNQRVASTYTNENGGEVENPSRGLSDERIADMLNDMGINAKANGDGTFTIQEFDYPEETFSRDAIIRHYLPELRAGRSNPGIYEVYIDPGDNPLTFDAKGKDWNDLDLSEFGIEGTETNDLANWAKEQGYTSVIIENVWDTGSYSDLGNASAIPTATSVIPLDGAWQIKSAEDMTFEGKDIIPLSERFDKSSPNLRYSTEQGLRERIDNMIRGGIDEQGRRLTPNEQVRTTLQERARKAAQLPSARATKLAMDADARGDTEAAATLSSMANRLKEIENSRVPGPKVELSNGKVSTTGAFTMRRQVYREALRNAEKNGGVVSRLDLAKILAAEEMCAPIEDAMALDEAMQMVDTAVAEEERLFMNEDAKSQKEIQKLRDQLADTKGELSLEKKFEEMEKRAIKKELKAWARDQINKLKEKTRYLNSIKKEAERERNLKKEKRQKTIKLLNKIHDMRLEGTEFEETAAELLDGIYLNAATKTKPAELRANVLKAAYDDIIKQQEEDAELLYDMSRKQAIEKGLMQEIPLSEEIKKKIADADTIALSELTPEQVEEIYLAAQALEKNVREAREFRRNGLNFNGDIFDREEFADELIAEVEKAKGSYKGLKKLYGISSLNPKSLFNKMGGYKLDSNWSKIYETLKAGQTRTFTVNHQLSDKLRSFAEEHKSVMKKWFGRKQELIDTGVDVKTDKGETIRLRLTPQQRMSLYMHMQNAQNLGHIVGRQSIVIDPKTGRPTVKYGLSKKVWAVSEEGVDKPKLFTTKKKAAEYLDSIEGKGTMFETEKAPDIGGMVVPDYDLTRKGKISQATNIGTVVKPTYEQLEQIVKGMSQEELAFCQTVREMFDEAADLVNEVSIDEVGYYRMIIENYFPIFTKSSSRESTQKAEFNGMAWDAPSESVSDAAIFHSRTGDISSPLVLGNITDIANSYIDKVANYVGLAVPLYNLNKAVKTKGVRDAITHADTSGNDSFNKYIDNLTRDLAGQKMTTDMLDRLRSHYAQGVLGGNIGVVLKQAASYPTAAAVVGHEALVKGFGRKVNEDTVIKYSPYYAYRSLGKGSVSLGDLTSDNVGLKILNKLDLIQKMDMATVKKLWGAAEVYVENNFPSLEKGSDAYYKKVGEIHGRIIAETQPNYTTLERPELLRSKSPTVRSLLMFRTQLMQNYNLLYDSIAEFNARKREGTLTKDDRLRLGRTVSSQMVAAATIAAITIGNNLLKGNDDDLTDEEGKLELDKLLKSFGLRSMESFSGMFVGGSEAVSIAEQIWESVTGDDLGTTSFDVTMPQIEIFNDLGVGLINLIGKMADPNTSNSEKMMAIRKMGFSVAKLFGIPAENVMKYATGVPKMLDNIGVTDGSFTAMDEDFWYGTDLKKIENEKHENIKQAKFEEYVRKLMPDADPAVIDEVYKIYEKQKTDDTYDIREVLVNPDPNITIDKQDIEMTKAEKETYLNAANEEYNGLAAEYMNSVEYKELNDYERYAGLTEIKGLAYEYAKSVIAKEKGLVYNYDELKEVEDAGIAVGDYLAYRARMSQIDETGMKKYVLANLDFDDETKVKLYKYDFEKEGAKKNIDTALNNGMTVNEFLRTDMYMNSGMMDEADKVNYIAKRINGEDTKAATYHQYVEDDNTKYEDSIMYAKDNGIKPSTYLRREQELNQEFETNVERYTKTDLKYEDGDITESVINKSRNTTNREELLLKSLLDGGYSEKEMDFFYQKEHPDDDKYVIARGIGLDTPSYINYELVKGNFTGIKDENGKTITGSKRDQIENYINNLKISDIQKLALLKVETDYVLEKEEYQAIIDLVNRQNISQAMKLRVFDELGIRREGGTVYPEKAK